jgi:hypothetical protein
MTPHLNEEQVRSYRERSLAAAHLLRASNHLAECEDCRSRILSSSELHAGVDAFRKVLDARSTVPSHLAYEEIAAYVDGQLSSQETARIEKHGRGCTACASDIAQLEALKREITPEPTRRLGWFDRLLDFGRPVWGWKGSFALAGAAACILLAVVLLQQRIGPPTKVPASGATSVQMASIRDGGRTISIAVDGSISGLDALPESYRASLGRILTQREIPVPAVLSDLSGKQGVLLGSSTEASAVELLGPLSVVIETQRPLFRWKPLAGAEYRVSVYNEGYDPVASSGWIHIAEWQTPPLPRGARYSWQLNVRDHGRETSVPIPPAPEARFRVLDAAGEQEITRLKAIAGDSHLLLGLQYAQAGLLDDAERELRRVRDENPSSQIVSGLLASVERLGSFKR